MLDCSPTRPVLRWYGGKWRLAPWIIRHFPPHRVYVEPFGGAGSVLLRKPRSDAEVWNDLDDWAVNLFRVLRDDQQSAKLIKLLSHTPFSRSEFESAREIGEADADPVEMARLLVVRSFMGFGANAHNGRSTGFRGNAHHGPSGHFYGNSQRSNQRSLKGLAHDWAGYPAALVATVERLKGVTIESRDAFKLIPAHDGPESLFYVDPPYLPETRSRGNPHDLKYRSYRHELSQQDHERLLTMLCGLKGMVALSGYPAPLYDKILAGWQRIEVAAYADGARARVEALWLNPACVAALEKPYQVSLFEDLNEVTGFEPTCHNSSQSVTG